MTTKEKNILSEAKEALKRIPTHMVDDRIVEIINEVGQHHREKGDSLAPEKIIAEIVDALLEESNGRYTVIVNDGNLARLLRK